jgi:hypothetical protein
MSKDTLLSVPEKKYGSEYRNHFFEQYKMYVESIEKISDRRQNANNYFITINTALITLIGLSMQYKILTDYGWLKAVVAMVGLLICVIFWFLIRSYKQLNTGKFKVVHEIEEFLPLALFKHEWELLGKGKKNEVYYPFSHVELLIPWAFGIIYLVLFFVLLKGIAN